MKDVDTRTKSSKRKRRKHSPSASPDLSEISSESENGDFPLSKDSAYQEGQEESIDSDDSSPDRVIGKKKRHRCKYKEIEMAIEERVQDETEHRIHKRHHRRKSEEHRHRHEKVVIKVEPIDHHYHYHHHHYPSRHYHSSSSHKRKEGRKRERVDDTEHSSHSHSSHRHHRESGGDHMRHHKRQDDGQARDAAGEPSYKRRSSAERAIRDQQEIETRKNETRRSRWKVEREEEPVVANRPIKQEPVDDYERAYEWGKKAADNAGKLLPAENKAKPNFGLSGKLTEDANTFNGVVIKYSEPPEARKPKRRWRFYPFKGDQGLPTLYVHRHSCYLIGRDRKVADLPIDHPSCSKQHAALQYRLVPYERENGTKGRRVRPYIIDLDSANGTFVNNVKIEQRKYVELMEKDVIKFGYSSREYVLLHEQSKDDTADDDVPGNE